MQNDYQKSLIIETNLRFYGVNLKELYIKTGEVIAEKLIAEFGKKKDFEIICGLGGNGADGISIGYSLIQKGVKTVSIYLIGRAGSIENPAYKEVFDLLEDLSKKSRNLIIKQDCYSKDIQKMDIVIESLTGTGVTGEKLNKRFLDVINRISHFNIPIIAIDTPTFSYIPDKTYSINYPKFKNAEVVSIDYPGDIEIMCGPGDAKYLFVPNKITHKTKNGKLLVICNTSDLNEIRLILDISNQYSTNIFLYNLHPLFNETNITKTVKEFQLDNIEVISDEILEDTIGQVDSIFLSKFDSISLINKAVIQKIFEYKRNIILSESALNIIDLSRISGSDCIIIIDRQYIKKNNIKNSSLKSLAINNSLNIISLDLETILYNSDNDFRIINSRSTFLPNYKNVLSILTAILSTKNSKWDSMKGAAIIIDIASRFKDKKGEYYENIEAALNWCIEF